MARGFLVTAAPWRVTVGIVIISIALTSAIMFILAGLTWWAARLVHVGSLDAQALAEKAAWPAPTSALEWPELHVLAVVSQPGEHPFVLLHVEWPDRPRCEGAELELRRRQSLDRVHAFLIAEDSGHVQIA